MRIYVLIPVLVVVLLGAGMLAGCKTSPPEQVSVTKGTVVCPQCKTVTRKTAFGGGTYDVHLCPGCKNTYTEMPGYEGFYDERTLVHVCDHCKALVEQCPVCRKKQQGE